MSDPSVAPPPLLLPAALRAEIVDHARAEWPRECCGVVIGPPGEAHELRRMCNIAPGNKLYEIDPQQLYDLEFNVLPANDWVIGVIYHSHPASPAYPSATDVSLAFWPDAYYVICSLADQTNPDLRAFRIAGEQISEAAIIDP